MYRLSGEFWGYKGWQTWKEWGWEEKYLHFPSVDGYLLGKGFGIRDVENIWSLTLGPATKLVGTEGMGFSSLVGAHSGVG